MLFWWNIDRPAIRTKDSSSRQRVLQELDNRMGEFLEAKRDTGCQTVIDKVSTGRRSVRNERELDAAT
ncbi:MAG: hypothetical protein ABJN26_08560 [Stappiaceae bacterium]